MSALEKFNFIQPRNPNLLSYIDDGRDKQNFYLVMEFCNGGNLQGILKLLKESGNVDSFENIIFEIAKQMANALLGICSLKNNKAFITF